MKKTLIAISSAILVIVVGSSSINAPKSLTHANGNDKVPSYSSGCQSCHSSATSPGGSIQLKGLPDTVIAGQRYPISITITDASQKRWGFDMQTNTGTFTIGAAASNLALTGTTNVHHGTSAPITAPPSYTFDSIYWTAPTKIPANGKGNFGFAGVAANGDGGKSGDHCYNSTFSTVIVPNTLPIKLESFTSQVSGSAVKLNWLTASELNSDHFEVERSTDGQNFVFAGKVSAAGSATTTKSYAYTDDASKLKGTVYYRLKLVDKNGSSTYSKVISTPVSSKNYQLSIYPNPLKSGQDLKLTYVSEKAGTANFQVINSVGKKVINFASPINEGSNSLSLPLTKLLPGIYYVAVAVNNTIVQKVPVMVQ